LSLIINAECKEISNDVISDISEVGSIVRIGDVVVTSTASTEQDVYAKFYGQTKDETPIVSTTYDLQALITYEPTEDVLKSSGLDEKCSVMIMIVTLQLFDLGMFTLENSISDVIADLKRNKVITINGTLFLIKNIGMTSILNGYPIICNLGCELYA
jgi:hypothetical protein